MLKHISWFKNLQKQPVPSRKENKAEHIVNWQAEGGKNNLPQQYLSSVYSSSIGKAALQLWQEFVEGNGLVEGGEEMVNKKQTLNDLHALLSYDLVYLFGLSFIQKYSPEGVPTMRYHLPFEETRLGIPQEDGKVNKIFHNPYYGVPQDFDTKYTKWYYDFNDDPEIVKEEIRQHNIDFLDKKTGLVDPPYPGQAYWMSIEQPGSRVYPRPLYYACLDWLQLDAKIPAFHVKNIDNNMLLSVMINMNGDPSAPAGPAEAEVLASGGTLDQSDTVGGVMDRQLKSFVQEKGGVLINWFQKEDEKATFEQFPNNANDDTFLNLQKQTFDAISIGTETPRILVGLSEAGKLGDTEEILNAVLLMQGRTQRLREMLTKLYESVFHVLDGTIKKNNPVNIIPENVWGSLTLEEQRIYIEKNHDIELIEKEIVNPIDNG